MAGEETPEQQVARLTAELATLTTANEELQGRLDTSVGELRSVRHKATFAAVAAENGVRPKAIDSLYRLSGYDPGEVDEADPKAVAALIKASKDDYPFCFEDPEAEVVKPGKAAPPKPAAIAAGKGKAPPAADKFRVSRANTSDPKWLSENAKAYGEAGKAGTLEILDED